MAKDTVTNRQLYNEIMKVHDKIDEVVDKRITPLERTVDKLLIYASIGATVGGLVITAGIDWVKEKLGLKA